MAPFIFANAMLRGEKINIFNAGNMVRDFTYIDDIVKGDLCARQAFETAKVQQLVTVERGVIHTPQYFNIGNGQPTQLLDFVKQLELALGVNAEKKFLPMQAGDVPQPTLTHPNLPK